MINKEPIILIIPTHRVSVLLQTATYSTPSLTTEGFIHACTEQQVNYVVKRFYGHEPKLTLLLIDPERVYAKIKYESASVSEYGDFPHIYGPLNTDAIIEVQQYSQDDFVV